MDAFSRFCVAGYRTLICTNRSEPIGPNEWEALTAEATPASPNPKLTAISNNEQRGARRADESAAMNAADLDAMPASQTQVEMHLIEVEFGNGHTYLFTYTDATRDEMKQHIGRCAADPQHPLTWLHAAQICKLIRCQEMGTEWDGIAATDADESTDGGWDYTNDALDQLDDD